MPKMSDMCKETMTKEFGFKKSELVNIEDFMNQQNQKTAKEILDAIIKDKKLSIKQKIILSYVVGNSAREAAIQESQKGIKKDIDNIYINTSSGVPPIGG